MEPRFPFVDTAKRLEKREQPEPVYNVLEVRGLPSRPEMRRAEMRGEDAVVKNFKPLTRIDCPNIVIGIPHAGENAPATLKDRLTEEGTETMSLLDLGTPEIFRSENIPWAQFGISRFAVDPNREPSFEAKKSEHGNPPGTLLWTEGLFEGPMYKEGQQPTPEEVEEWAERYYLPYYNAVMGAVGTLADRRKDKQKQRILIIDGHSFPLTDNAIPLYQKHYAVKDMADFPTFILGTRDNEGCDEDILSAFEAELQKAYDALPEEKKKLICEDEKRPLFLRNYKMKGVHNVKFWGKHHEEYGINAIQVECNEAAYVDRDPKELWESFSYNHEKMAVLHELIEKTALALDPLLKNEK